VTSLLELAYFLLFLFSFDARIMKKGENFFSKLVTF